MTKKKVRLLLVFLCLFSATSVAMGDEEGREHNGGNSFFEKGFVTEGLKGKGDAAFPTPTALPQPPFNGDEPDVNKTNPDGLQGPAQQKQDDPAMLPEAGIDIFAEGQGVPVKKLAVILDGTKETGLADTFRTYSRLVRVRNLPAGPIYLAGHYGNIAPLMQKHGNALLEGITDLPSMSQIDPGKLPKPDPNGEDPEDMAGFFQALQNFKGLAQAFGIFTNIQFAGGIPPEYPVKLLPTWILTTESGDVVLEGLKDPSRYINPKGQFVMNDLLGNDEAKVPVQ